jgi:putative transposase
MELHKSAHTVYKTQYHIVWVTRFRRKILTKGVGAYLETKLREVTKYYADWEYVAIGIDVDHVHLNMIIPPKYSVSYAVETLKKNTSRQLSRKFRFLSKVYWDNQGIWSKGFFVSTVGINERVIRDYVNMQAKEDTGQAQLELGG